LEERANRNKKNLAEMNDIVTENEDLQQAMIRKDKVIEELEKQISMIIRDRDFETRKEQNKTFEAGFRVRKNHHSKVK